MNSKGRFVHVTEMKRLPFFDLGVNQIYRFNLVGVICKEAQEQKVLFSLGIFLKSKW